MSTDGQSQEVFKKLKASCVPLLANTLMTPPSIPLALNHLSELIESLREIQSSGYVLTGSLIAYVFFPLSTLLRRNASSTIPDQVLEKVLVSLGILCEYWWWECEMGVWDQIFMLSAAILGGIEVKGKGKDRDDETKEAASQCLHVLLRDRTADGDLIRSGFDRGEAHARLAEIQAHVQSLQFIHILGQTVNSLLTTACSPHISLQRSSLRLLYVIVSTYLPDSFVPSILPGVVSSGIRIALGRTDSNRKGWANGDTTAFALRVVQAVIIRSIGDEICIREGAVRAIDNLEDLADLITDDAATKTLSPVEQTYGTARTAVWLKATSSQLHIAINALTPLVSHPTSSALLALSVFARTLLSATTLTLSQTQPLLLSFLLSLSSSPFDSVSIHSRESLAILLSPPSSARHTLLHTLMQKTRDNLAALPLLLPSHSDMKVQHIASQIEVVCLLPDYIGQVVGITSISAQIGRLLGPTGGIEKWGWSLLNVLELDSPPILVTPYSTARSMLENGNTTDASYVFPELMFKHVSSQSTFTALEKMFRSLGHAGGEDCIFAIEWFISVGQNGRGSRAVSALWCAARILEGVGGFSLAPDNSSYRLVAGPRRRRAEKTARWLAKTVAELWDDSDRELDGEEEKNALELENESHLPIEHVKGLIRLDPLFDFKEPSHSKPSRLAPQPLLHRTLCLHIISIAAGILRARFTPLLLYTLYPLLHSLVSTTSYLSSTALAALHYITDSTSYASPSNLLLSNFDYALDAVSRRLTRRWLDVDATKVLVVLVRLVGRDVVKKAGDVVEECFDRLDEYHGYETVVEGLVEVLGEVVKVVEADEDDVLDQGKETPTVPKDSDRMNAFFDWFSHRQDPSPPEEHNDYGPAPREAWGKGKEKETEKQDEEDLLKGSDTDPSADPPETPTQALTHQIVTRSIYFLTHPSALIRARILSLLSISAPILSPSAFLPSIHNAWPFILNRLTDPESFVQSAAAGLMESLALAPRIASFMSRRIWDDVWPRFRMLLSKLDAADSQSALARRGARVGTESSYTHSHRLYRAILRTMTAAFCGNVHVSDGPAWEVMLAFRRFLHAEAQEELQSLARKLYVSIGRNNEDAVWLVLTATAAGDGGDHDGKNDVMRGMGFLKEPKWKLRDNINLIFAELNT